jgi:hypothetical protein
MKSKIVAIISITLVGVMLALPATSHAWRGGWGWGPGAFVGGALLGAAITAPYYAYPPPAYAYPPPAYAYPPPAYAYPSPPAYAYPSPPAAPQAAPSPQVQGRGQWVEVPGQTVSNMWVPPHKVWVPDNSPGNSIRQPTGAQPTGDSHSGTGEGS